MMPRFKPKGDRPQWQVIYDHIVGLEIGDVVKYDELHALLPNVSRTALYGVFTIAVKHVEEDRRRTFANVRSVGYRMVESVEHEGLARNQHSQAKRRLGAARRKLHSADRSRLTPEQRRRVDALEDHVSAQQEMIRRLDARVERAERGLQEVRREHRTDAAELSERVDRITDLLRRHGIESGAESARAETP
jgi:hypothetical protein